MDADGLRLSEERMRADGAPEAAVRSFAASWRRLAAGETGLVPEAEIEPLDELPDAARLEVSGDEVTAALRAAVVIKLNGGLGTSMGMTGPKALLEVKDGRTFLDVIARQVLDLRARHRARLPLVLMNSFRTRDDSLAALRRHPGLEADVPPDFLQGRVPKLREDDLEPVRWPADPELEWCPPGHGDLYPSLAASGMLDALLEHGYRYAFVSNSDNLGATLDERLLGWFAAEGIPFLMEACDRTPADRKGGHLARRRGGGLVLRESAQTPDEDQASFQDIARHRYFNTNNLWVDLVALARALAERDGVLGLPLMVNRKTVDPSDPASTPVLQLETAMGAAIESFDGARAVRVDRGRFVPVKTTGDLLVLRSDAYVLGPGELVVLDPARRAGPPLVDLDPAHYRLLAGFDERFPHGPPSLVACERLAVRGDVTFGRDVAVAGDVVIDREGEGPVTIEDGARLGGG